MVAIAMQRRCNRPKCLFTTACGVLSVVQEQPQVHELDSVAAFASVVLAVYSLYAAA